MIKRTIKIASIVIYAFFVFGCSSSARFTYNKETKAKKIAVKDKDRSSVFIPAASLMLKFNSIRVLLEAKSDNISVKTENEVILQDNETTLAILKPGSIINFIYQNNSIKAESDGIEMKAPYFNLIPANNDSLIKFNNKIYRGSLNISCDTNIKLINILSIDNYIKGVIPGEMPTGKGDEIMEAVKAFTICARTYAYSKLAEGKLLFDVYNDVRSQVYSGYKYEKKNANRAVEETANIVLTYNNSIAYVFYSSTCGGQTENVENVFGLKDIPYLVSIEDGTDPYCKISPAFQWTETLSKKAVITKLRNTGLLEQKGSYDIDDIEIISKQPSGRNKEILIKLTGDEDKEIIIKGGKLRTIFAPKQSDLLKSSNFEIELKGDEIILTGKGFGHGVGLCQYGAIGMAKAGKNFKEILEHYFPGTTITQGL